MNSRRPGGFTMWGLLAVVATLMMLAGVVVPFPRPPTRDAEVIRATAETEAVAAALRNLEEDLGRPPHVIGAQRFRTLIGPGTPPRRGAIGRGRRIDLSELLQRNGSADEAWRGPYLEHLQADPWGRSYVVHGHGYQRPDEQVWVLSAGPNGVLETAADSRTPGGDDLGTVLAR